MEVKVRKDCFAYNEEHKDCNALRELYCRKEECKFYKHRCEVNNKETEASIKNYAMNKK